MRGDVKALVQEAESTGRRADWRMAALAVVCFFGCRRMGDVVRVRVCDVTWDRERILRRQKTDVMNEGDTFSMVAGGKVFAIRKFLEEYIDVMGIGRKEALFPRNLGKGPKREAVTYSIMYQALEGAKGRLGLEGSLTWHSFRIGSATRGTSLGVRRSVVKGAGKWKSSCVDVYCREEDAGVILSGTLVDNLE